MKGVEPGERAGLFQLVTADVFTDFIVDKATEIYLTEAELQALADMALADMALGELTVERNDKG